jgi:hypothetical protein
MPTQYKHFFGGGKSVIMTVVNESLKGKHKQHCLCYMNCKFFHPGEDNNCDIADTLYNICVDYNVVTPVWECEKYEVK